MRLDVAGGQPPGVQGQDLVVKPLQGTLTLSHDLGLKAAVTITGRVDPDPAVLAHQRLGARPVAHVPHPTRRLLMRLIAQMIGQLDLHRPLHQAFGQLGQPAARPGDLLLTASAGRQLVNHLVRDPLAIRARHHLTQSGAVDGVLHPIPAEPQPLLRSRRGRRRLAWRLAAGAIPVRDPRSNIISVFG
jgi:hypothetical protein